MNYKVKLIASAGKGEMVRQELTGGWVTSRLGKPHPEQDQIEGQKDARSCPRVGRLTLLVTAGLDRWSSLRREHPEKSQIFLGTAGRGTELGL